MHSLNIWFVDNVIKWWHEFYKKKKIHIKTNLVEEFLVADTSEHVVKKIDADHIFNWILDLKIKFKSGNCPETMVTMSVVSCTRNQKI